MRRRYIAVEGPIGVGKAGTVTALEKRLGATAIRDMPNPFEATRYHSLCVLEETLPAEFLVTARADADEVMGIRHRALPIEGVQFHPESFLTGEGSNLLRNFLAMKAPA